MNTYLKSFLLFLFIGASTVINCQEDLFAHVNGAKIHYKSIGEGEPVLLLHNFTASHKMWIPWVEDLPQNYMYIIPDLRAHGLSSNPSKVFRHSDSDDDMYGLMDFLGI